MSKRFTTLSPELTKTFSWQNCVVIVVEIPSDRKIPEQIAAKRGHLTSDQPSTV